MSPIFLLKYGYCSVFYFSQILKYKRMSPTLKQLDIENPRILIYCTMVFFSWKVVRVSFNIGPNFLCWISGVVPFNLWLISSWEKIKCCYKLSKCTKWHLFHSKWLKLSFWLKIVVILSVAQLVTKVIFFSTWDKSRVKWDNSRNSTQKMRIIESSSASSVLFNYWPDPFPL